MNKGFYILQFVDNDIKVETISYLDTFVKFDKVVKAVFIGESISDLIYGTSVRSVDGITNKIMHTANLLTFNKAELLHIKKLISNLVADYLK